VYLRYSGAKKGNSVGIEFQILGWVGPDVLNAEGLELAVDRGQLCTRRSRNLDLASFGLGTVRA
jgi:hypothetical protein